ncbi:hypothetical protein LZD49_35015 [Dyadobacter sp. CY261]|uniref:IS66 family insertion sequence element accessory protein TnpA n=1 Tax=Dyadobacter sp. CY261 TaxID=2907203 RepID=UPI001F31328D|nr:hypothetical protein [Dyadobacter sp. CY261]MCF0075735.1 hypothetical protein [Dyadobacter sp. CY261]
MKTDTEQMRVPYDQWCLERVSKQPFCNRNGISYYKFNYWVKKFRRDNANESISRKGFSQIAIQQPPLPQPQRPLLASFIFASGARLELFTALDSFFIKELAN